MVAREIDRLVAEILGVKIADQAEWNESLGQWELNGLMFCPRYHADIKAAWEIVDAWKGDGKPYSAPSIYLRRDSSGQWECMFMDAGVGRDLARCHPVTAETAPLAICLAALKAYGIEVP